MFRRKSILKTKHYLVIVFAIVVIAFFQSFILFLGNLLVILGVIAYVYSDLTPEAQDDLENKVSDSLKKARDYLRNSSQKEPQLAAVPTPKRTRLQRLLGRNKEKPQQAENYEIDVTPALTDAEVIAEHKNEREVQH